ncbi:MAG: hypothetical protein Q7S09_00390 [bacterium]|nr:hypothetical protein [bacterium]
MLQTQEKPRRYDILRMLVDEYVDLAEPIGSEVLCAKHQLSWSSATVRGDLSELEEEGYLAKPHVSGGRIPTDNAYRKIRDELLEDVEGFQERWNPFKEAHISSSTLGSSPNRVSLATRMLAELTNHLVLGGVLEKDELREVGLPSLIREPEFADQEAVAGVAAFMEHVAEETEDVMEKLLRNTFGVFIGEENTFREIRSCSLLVSGFRTKEGDQGFLAILGPTRMPYERNIAFLENVANALGKRI